MFRSGDIKWKSVLYFLNLSFEYRIIASSLCSLTAIQIRLLQGRYIYVLFFCVEKDCPFNLKTVIAVNTSFLSFARFDD